MKPLLQTLAKPPVVVGAAGVVALASFGAVFFSTMPAGADGPYAAATRGSITEEVDAPIAVKAAETTDLSFETSGRIVSPGPQAGAHVAAGEILASISASDAQAALDGAQAAREVQQAKLDALKAGARPEDVAVSQAAVAAAQTSLEQAKQTLAAAARDAYVKSDDAIRNRVDQFVQNPLTPTPSLPFPLSDSSLQNSILSDRVAMEVLLTGWETYLASLPENPGDADMSAAASRSRDNLSKIGAYLDEAASGLTKAVPTSGYPLATIEGYEASVATARANVSASLSALDAAAAAEKAAESGLATAQSQLALKQAPAASQDVEAEEAQIAVAQANLDQARAALAKTSIAAPFAGVITGNDAHAGEIAAPGAPLISMISDAKFQMDAYVSQADVGKIRANDAAEVSLDAYPGQALLGARVVSIDPAATIQNGASSYKVTLQFDGDDPRIRAGLTGDAKIATEAQRDAILVPSSAVIARGADRYVLRASASGDELAPVVAGISSVSGQTQIVSGISEGDSVRTFGEAQPQ